VWFAFFNLIPIPPLDGSKILISLLPAKQAYEYLKIEPYSMYILIALLLTGAVGFILRPFAAAFLNAVSFLLSLIF
jgi:Zn-dependent protease